jgi:NAD(P)-dependent dehydrogenase (short-subunit alcohol dehydrogenase family)
VRVLDISLGAGEETCRQITSAGGKASACACNVTDQKLVKETFRQLAANGPVSILVNNAGVSHIGTVESTTEADFDRVFRVNVKGYYNCMQAAVASMKANGGGVILNMASIAGSVGLADRFAYSMSKAAVISMTYSAARDCLAYKIRCNCISPARVHTPFVDILPAQYLSRARAGNVREIVTGATYRKNGGAGEVASLALFLCSDEASFITGVDYPIDGGFFNLHG